jgi:hypothetical protein
MSRRIVFLAGCAAVVALSSCALQPAESEDETVGSTTSALGPTAGDPSLPVVSPQGSDPSKSADRPSVDPATQAVPEEPEKPSPNPWIMRDPRHPADSTNRAHSSVETK